MHDFMRLSDAGGSDRMALAFQTAGWVDRQTSVECGLALLESDMTRSLLEEPDLFALRDLEDREGIVELGNVDIRRF